MPTDTATALPPSPTVTAPPATSTATPSPTPTPDLVTRLQQNPMQPRDYIALVSGLRGGTPIPHIVRRTPQAVSVGASRGFWVADLEAVRYERITATLRLQTEHLQMWVQEGYHADEQGLAEAARVFEERIYPTNRAIFGREWSPGIDGSEQLVILNAAVRGASGYFASANEYPQVVNPYSNEHEMFVMNIDVLEPGSEAYNAILAHEYQHMIQWHVDGNEDAWLNEGLSELAEELNGFGWPRGAVFPFQRQPDLQLNTWNHEPGHYGASYLMIRYLYEQLGEEALREIVQHPASGIASIDAVIDARGLDTSFDALFADWLVANALDRPRPDARYGYQTADLNVQPQVTVTAYPAEHEDTVRQYAGDYYRVTLPESGRLRARFEGQPVTRLVPNMAYDGNYQWWSNRGDSSHAYLQRRVDLTDVQTATLSYGLWYDIEAGWDYGYVRVSTDGGQSWTLLRGEHTTDHDPNGNALGPGYTGKSGQAPEAPGDGPARWVRERVDLSAYAGQDLLLRFDYVTDDGVNRPGLCLDDMRIEALGFVDDVEAGDAGWHASGFIRHDNALPQRYIVQWVSSGEGVPDVARLAVSLDGTGEWLLDAVDAPAEGPREGLLIIAALAPVTTEPAAYRLTLEEVP
jgi:hypothetical protein